SHACQDRGVLHGDHRLIIVAIECPCAHLIARQLAAMQETMKWVQIVVARMADFAERVLKGSGRKRLTHSETAVPRALAIACSRLSQKSPLMGACQRKLGSIGSSVPEPGAGPRTTHSPGSALPDPYASRGIKSRAAARHSAYSR